MTALGRYLLCCAILAAVVLPSGEASDGPVSHRSLDLQGYVLTEMTYWDSPGRPGTKWTDRIFFDLVVARGRWRMEMTRQSTSVRSRMTFDGTNFYCLWPTTVSGDLPQARVWPGPLPPVADKGLLFAWFAFCPSASVTSAGGRVPPLFSVEHADEALPGHTVPGRIVRSPRPPYPPISAYFVDEAILRTNSDGSLVRLPPFRNGFTNIAFTATGLTNVDGLTVAIGFEAESYVPFSNGSNTVLRTAAVYVGCVTSILLTSDVPEARPALSGPTYFHDFRAYFASMPADTVQYVTNRWLSDKEFLRRPEYQRLRNVAVATSASTRSTATCVSVFLALSGWLLFTMYAVRRIRGRRTQQQSSEAG